MSTPSLPPGRRPTLAHAGAGGPDVDVLPLSRSTRLPGAFLAAGSSGTRPVIPDAGASPAAVAGWLRQPRALAACVGLSLVAVAATAYWAGTSAGPSTRLTPASVTAPPGPPVDARAPAAPTASAGRAAVPSSDEAGARDARGPAEGAAVPVCAQCGRVESVQAVQQKGSASGAGAVAGGVVGGVLGHQVGGGNGKKALTVLGAIGGGLAGHEIEKRARSVTVWQVRLRMDDGSVRTLSQSSAPQVGDRVRVNGTRLQALAS